MAAIDWIPFAIIPIVIIVVIKLIIHLRQNKDDYPFKEWGEEELAQIGFKVKSSVKLGVIGYYCKECEFKTEPSNYAEARSHCNEHHKK